MIMMMMAELHNTTNGFIVHVYSSIDNMYTTISHDCAKEYTKMHALELVSSTIMFEVNQVYRQIQN